MRKIIKYKLICILTFTFGCSDYIDNEVTGSQLLENHFSNLNEVETAVIGAYASLSPQDWWQNDYFWLVGDICSDDAFSGNTNLGDQRDFHFLADFNITPTNEWLDIKWRYMYQGIFRCNLIIENTPNAPITQEQKNFYIAEAQFLRGLYYFELVKNFGGVPLISEPLSAEEANIARSSEADSWVFIENDFLQASNFLPLKSEQNGESIGRATKGAALGFLAKAYLYQNKFAEAQNYANQIILSLEYNLNDSFDNVWNINNPNGNGSIFEIQQSFSEIFDSGSALPVITRSRVDGGWGFCTPSSHLDNFMANDPRRVHTIIRQGEFVNNNFPSYDTSPGENMTGRINRKYFLDINDRPTVSENTRSGLNHILLRYADLLLMYAEASYQLGAEQEARNALNLVRNRVGLNNVVLSGPELLDAIYKERRLELALEGHRYYDLKRTNRLATAMADFIDYNMNTSTDTFDAGNDQGQFFNNAIHTLFPIPQSEIDLTNGIITQNPNY